MAYITRELERKFLKMNGFFKAILVTGARQVGKTTMLKHLAEGTNRTYVSLDNAMARDLAQSDPVLFFQTYKPPILIDEVQKAPELFEQIKIICDETDEKGFSHGHTAHFIEVHCPSESPLQGKLLPVCITDYNGDACIGKIAPPKDQQGEINHEI